MHILVHVVDKDDNSAKNEAPTTHAATFTSFSHTNPSDASYQHISTP